MKAMFIAFAAIIIIAVAADLILDQIGFSSMERTAGVNVQLDN